jgi:hypothetical protein
MAQGRFEGFKYGKVEDIVDENGAGRIRVRLFPDDNDIHDPKQLPYAIPANPKFFSVKPKVGEGVLVQTSVINDKQSQRYFFGPLISQENKLNYDPFFMGADSLFLGGAKGFDQFDKVDGVYGDDNDIVISGRKNCDIQVKEDDIRLRAGVKLVDESNENKVSFNQDHPSYLKLKYHPVSVGDTKSTATMVADKILLLSNNSAQKKNGNGKLNLTDTTDLINDDEIRNVLENCYKLPYGEVLVEFLEKFMNIFINHTHDFIQLPPNSSYIQELKDAASDPITNKKMLSDTVRIN